MNDQELLQKIKQGDQKSLVIIFDLQYENLVRVAHRLISDLDAAEDVVQEVFINFWEKRDKLEIQSSLSAYLKQSVIFRSIDYLRKTKRQGERNENYHKSSLQLDVFSPESELLSKENLASIYEKIEALPAKSKLIFKLSRFEELSYAEIATQLGVSPKTVEYHISKALELLRKSVFGLFVYSFFEV